MKSENTAPWINSKDECLKEECSKDDESIYRVESPRFLTEESHGEEASAMQPCKFKKKVLMGDVSALSEEELLYAIFLFSTDLDPTLSKSLSKKHRFTNLSPSAETFLEEFTSGILQKNTLKQLARHIFPWIVDRESRGLL